MIYLDNAATTQMCRDARETENDLWDVYGNPASGSSFGVKAKMALETARGSIANRICAGFGEVFFTSGATEGNNWAIRGAVEEWNIMHGDRGLPHVITSMTEHHSVLNTVKALEERGECTATYIAPDSVSGSISKDDIMLAMRPETALVSVMMVNNETGARNPVEEIGAAVSWYRDCTERHGRRCHVLFHVDATQALGKTDVNVKDIRCDMLTGSGHKFHAGKGCGIMYRRMGAWIGNLMYGGGQQFGLRPGTEDPVAAARMAIALDEELDFSRGNGMRDMLSKIIETALEIDGVYINGHPFGNSGIVNLSFNGVSGEALLMALEGKGVVCSSGSACSMGGESHVLQAMGLGKERIDGAVRISVGRMNTMSEVQDAMRILKDCVEELRRAEVKE